MKYEPHEYQRYAINYIEDHPFAAVLLDMGLGKTSITLTAIADLLFDSFEVHKVLVIAPLRVARDTWSAELQKWDQLHHLTYSVVVGSEAERKAALTKKADIYIINRENVQWLIEKSKLPFDYDMIVVGELSSFILKSRNISSGIVSTPSGISSVSSSAFFLASALSANSARYVLSITT